MKDDDTEATDLYRKHRPRQFKDVIGNVEVVASIRDALKTNKLPHAIMMTGDSGCGKTTIARILNTKLGGKKNHYTEINASEKRGIQMIRTIGDTYRSVSMFGGCRVYVIDEAQGLTSAAQNALLKCLEDAPTWSYFVLCTTDPTKIIKTIHTRCTQYKLKALDKKEIKQLLDSVCDKEKTKKVSSKVVDRVFDISEGSPRKALVLLQQVYKLKTEDAMLDTIQKSATRQQAIDLVRKLIQPKPQWSQVKELLKEMTDDPEMTRRIMIGYASSVCMGGGPLAKRSLMIYEAFRDMFVGGRPDLVFACYSICAGS